MEPAAASAHASVSLVSNGEFTSISRRRFVGTEFKDGDGALVEILGIGEEEGEIGAVPVGDAVDDRSEDKAEGSLSRVD